MYVAIRTALAMAISSPCWQIAQEDSPKIFPGINADNFAAFPEYGFSLGAVAVWQRFFHVDSGLARYISRGQFACRMRGYRELFERVMFLRMIRV